MSRWVKQEYEGAISFLFIIIGATIPWGFGYADIDPFGRVISFHWWFGKLQYIPSVDGIDEWYWVRDAIQLQEGTAVYNGYLAGGLGTAIFAGAVILCLALFVRDEQINNIVPIRYAAGALLVASGACYTVATIWISMKGPGWTAPVGALFNLFFGAVLLTNQFRVTQSLDAQANADAADDTATPDGY